LLQSDVNLVIGADWQGVRSTPGPLPDLPTTTAPTSTTAPSGRTTTTTTTVPASSTTSTTVGVVPETPPDVRC